MGNLVTHSETELIDRLRGSDEEAFSLLFRRHYPPLCFFAGRYIRDFAAAESLVQEVFVRLWDGRQALHIRVSLKSYLYTSVKNACLNHIKRERFSYPLQSVEGRSDATVPQPDVEVESQDISAAVQRAIRDLPSRQQETVSLAKYDGLSYQEIAEIQNVSINTVKTQLKRALRTLSKSLQYLQMVLLFLKF